VSRLSGLRPRITLLVAAVVALCLVVSFAAVYRGTTTALRDSTDRGLRDDLATLRASVTASTPADATRQAQAYIARVPSRATTRVVFVVPPGEAPVTNEPELLDTTGHDTDDTPSERDEEEADARTVLTAEPGYTTRELPGVGKVRVLTAETHGAHGTTRFGVAEPIEPIEEAEETTAKAFLLAGILGLVGALLGGLFVASRVATPLRRMARVAARVDEGDLGPRMALTGRDDEIRALAQSFDQMLDRLEDAFARQAAFVADASHELRTPLTIVRGQLEVLAMADDPTDAEIRHVQRIVSLEIDRMGRLVEDLVLLAHAADDGFLRTRPIDVPDFLTTICDGLRATADRRLVLAPVPPIVMEADPDRLAQALRNLLTNAIAHTAPGGLVRLTAGERGDGVRFLVDDDGPGIPPDARLRIFDRFARLDAARARQDGGAGLGLSIVQAIALAHGGTVRADASPEGGARMVLDLPRVPPR
jgi:signal transduction histidine kinase